MKEIPSFLEDLIKEQYGKEISEKIIKGYVEKKTTLRVNTLKSDKIEVENNLRDANINFSEIGYNENALIINERDKIRDLDIYKNGKIYLQSLSSMLPPIVLNPKPNENVLDMTAAPGGKTSQIAAITNNEAFITACEKNKIRFDRLKYNLEKQGVKSVNIMKQDARELSDFFSFEKILLDAPCSGSGTENIFKDNFTKELIEKSSKAQEKLFRKAMKILKDGGEMVYSTCSILKQENEDILKKNLNSNFEIIPIDLPSDIPTLPTKILGTVCICPNELYEGFFVAKIRKIRK